nr:MAG TPA: hypothetical protein [Bacteriophage sp.]
MKSGRASEIQTLCRFILEQDTGLEPAAYCLGSMEYCCEMGLNGSKTRRIIEVFCKIRFDVFRTVLN